MYVYRRKTERYRRSESYLIHSNYSCSLSSFTSIRLYYILLVINSLGLLRQLPPITILDLSQSVFIYGYMYVERCMWKTVQSYNCKIKRFEYNGISIILIIMPLFLLLLRQLPPLTILDLSESTFIYGYMWIDGKLFNLIITT